MPQAELTDRFCRSVKPDPGRQIDHFDTVVKGLTLTVSPGGTKAWGLFYTKPASGKRARMKIGRYPEISLAKAREKARETRATIGEGQDPATEKKALENAQTVSDLVGNYIKRQAATKRTGPAIERRLRKNVEAAIGNIKLGELHRRDLTRVIDAIKDRGAATEANRVFEDMRAMIRWARGRGDLDDNLMEGMRKPSETVERDRVLTPREIEMVWHALPDADMRESTRRIIRLCLITGQRVGEICGMTQNEIDLGTGIWTIPPARSKNGRAHSLPLPAIALDIIRTQLAEAEALAERKGRERTLHIFPAPGGGEAVKNASISKAIKRNEVDGRVMGIVPFTPHDLRRTCATGMEEMGISPFVVGHVLNHVSITKASITSRVYARYSYEREKREALAAWADRLEAIICGNDKIVKLSQVEAV